MKFGTELPTIEHSFCPRSWKNHQTHAWCNYYPLNVTLEEWHGSYGKQDTHSFDHSMLWPFSESHNSPLHLIFPCVNHSKLSRIWSILPSQKTQSTFAICSTLPPNHRFVHIQGAHMGLFVYTRNPGSSLHDRLVQKWTALFLNHLPYFLIYPWHLMRYSSAPVKKFKLNTAFNISKGGLVAGEE